MQILVHSFIRYLVSSFTQTPDLSQLYHFSFFLLQNACDKNSQCQNNATCQSRFTLKGYWCLCAPPFKLKKKNKEERSIQKYMIEDLIT